MKYTQNKHEKWSFLLKLNMKNKIHTASTEQYINVTRVQIIQTKVDYLKKN